MTQKADIQKCSAEDIPEIALIEKKYIPGGWSEGSFFDWFENCNRVIFKAVVNGELIGFVNGSWVLEEGEILNIAVEEKLRNQGIASRLIKTLEEHFSENNVEKIFLEVREKNISAIKFYEKHKFIKNGMRKNYYTSPTDNGILMTKKIR